MKVTVDETGVVRITAKGKEVPVLVAAYHAAEYFRCTARNDGHDVVEVTLTPTLVRVESGAKK